MFKHIFVIVILLACQTPASFGQLQDTTVLKELVVRSKRAWVEDNKIVLIPSKQEKKLSDSPSSLIEQMRLPFIKVKDDVVSGNNGKPIQLFINGEPVTEIDRNTFVTNNVKRIEYLENPSDPTFRGASAAINFITSTYELGGVVRIRGFQAIPNNGVYIASAKLECGKMAYGIMLESTYGRNHRAKSIQTQTYKGIYYNDSLLLSLDNISNSHLIERYDHISLTLNARYTDKNLSMTHTGGLIWNKSPGDINYNHENWEPQIFTYQQSTSYEKYHNFHPQISGNYKLKLSDRIYFMGAWSYIFNDNQTNSQFKRDQTQSIDNKAKEQSHSLQLLLAPYMQIHRRFF